MRCLFGWKGGKVKAEREKSHKRGSSGYATFLGHGASEKRNLALLFGDVYNVELPSCSGLWAS